MKICEMKPGSEIILDFTADRKLKVILGVIQKVAKMSMGKLYCMLHCRKMTFRS